VAKLGVITDGISRDPVHALRVAADAGLEYAEFQYVWDKEVGDLDASEIKQLKQLTRDDGLKVSCISRHVLGPTVTMATKPGGEVHQAHMNALDRCITMAHEIESPLVRIFSGRKETILFGSGGAEHWNVSKNAWNNLLPLVEAAVRIAERRNITLVVETGNGTMVNSCWTARKLIDDIGSDNLKVLWDPANNCWAHERAFPDGYELIRGRYLGHIHIKDCYPETPKATLAYRNIGEGVLADQFWHISNALKADKYDGVISYESVYHPEGGTFEDGFHAAIGRLKMIFD
jgi:sugar phosphate isomerase/epimerase